jgi:hypothetical protein
LIFYFYSYKIFNGRVRDILQAKNYPFNDSENEKPSEVVNFKRNISNQKTSTEKPKNVDKDFQAPPKNTPEGDFNDNEKDEPNKDAKRELPLKVEDVISNSSNKYDKDFAMKEYERNKIYGSIMDFNDSEINQLKYDEALDIDERTYFQYYLSLVRTKNLFIFSFITKNDYNSRIIKMTLFFFKFTADFTVNGLFFNDSTMHKIYVDGGTFDFSYHIPQIIYSIIISSVLITIVRLTALTEDNVIKIKNASSSDIKKIYEKEAKSIKYKFIFFYIIIFILLLFLWYYVGCFCAVYKNTQIQLLKDTLISFATSLLYPFILYLIPGLFRIPALGNPQKNRKCLYNFSKVFTIL